MVKTAWLLLGLGLITIAECRNLNQPKRPIRRKLRIVVRSLPGESERREICIGDLGCYPDTEPGATEAPAFSFAAFKAFSQSTNELFNRDSRDYIATEFRWWAPGAEEAKVSEHRTMNVDGFDPGLKVKFVVHGFKASGDEEWAKEMKDAFQAKEQYNVFIVDWKKGANVFQYINAVENTWVVGAELGNFIVQLVENTGLNVADVHIIGHSLGAHISGYAGKWVKNKLQKPVGRITGLDPAGPEFYDNIPGERLDIGDAAFVDVIHTNWAFFTLAGLGLFKPVGHFDFYPNGGADQPGCKTQTDALMSLNQDDFACSHSRAIELFIESIKSESCTFMADQCADSDDLRWKEKCPIGEEGTLRVPMGYHADEYKQNIDEKESKSFYLETNGEPPYCKA